MLHSTRFANLPTLILALLGLTLLGGCSVFEDSALKKDVAELRQQVDKLQELISPAPVKLEAYKEYGFTLPLPQGGAVQTAGISGNANASKDQGQLTAFAGGVGMVLIWTKQTIEPTQAVQGAFEVLQASQPSGVFRPVNQGTLTVDSQTGQYGSFAALDKDQKVISIGAIGSWSCKNSQNFVMTAVGANQQDVETSFQAFSTGFKCPV